MHHEKPQNPTYTCNYPGCGASFRHASSRVVHMRSHTGERPYACTHPGCGATFNKASARQVHERQHSNNRPYKCQVPGCPAAFIQSSDRLVHMRSHTGDRPFVCNTNGCADAFKTSSDLHSHIRTQHTNQPKRVRKDTENAVIAYLTSHLSLPIIREFYVNLKPIRGRKSSAKIDAVLYCPRRHMKILLEIDEQQHKRYDEWDEARRMIDATTRIYQEENNTPPSVLWIRFNPDAWHVNGQLVRVPKELRYIHLLDIINNYQPQHSPDIVYVYYDAKTLPDHPTRVVHSITLHAAFIPLKQSVVSITYPSTINIQYCK